jgi:hypothetical protein
MALHTIPVDEAPSGLAPGQTEEAPLGVPEARPPGGDDEEDDRGPGAMPGIPSGHEPPLSA